MRKEIPTGPAAKKGESVRLPMKGKRGAMKPNKTKDGSIVGDSGAMKKKRGKV